MHTVRIHVDCCFLQSWVLLVTHMLWEEELQEFHISEFLSRIREKEYQSPKSNSNNAADNTNVGIVIILCL